MKKYCVLVVLFIMFIISIIIVGVNMISGDILIEENFDIMDIQRDREIYYTPYGYDIDNPNIVINPYNISPLTALIMFESKDYTSVKVTIKGKDDNSYIVNTFKEDKYHMIPIYGLYPDYDNTVIIETKDKKKTINIKTDKLPNDFMRYDVEDKESYKYYNINYPYIIDSNGDIRWYLNRHLYGNISIDSDYLYIGSDKYNEESGTISLYRLNLLGKIYNEYLVKDCYMGFNTIYKDNLLIKSNDKYILLDKNNGNVIDNINYNDREIDININSLYNSSNYYKIKDSSVFESLNVTDKSKDISLFSYKKNNDIDVDIINYRDRIKIVNKTGKSISVIFDKFLDKRVYDVDKIKYINKEGLKGEYTIYIKIEDMLYKTNYYVSV